MVQPPVVDPLARQMVASLHQVNANLKQYKSLSHVRVELEEQVQSAGAMALAAKLPNCLRAELLSTVGQPISSMVADGQTIHIRPYGKDRIYRFSQSATALKHLIHIPIGVEQLQGVLIGRPELPDHAGQQVVAQTAERVDVALFNRWKEMQALLQFDRDDGSIRRLEVFDQEEQSLYWVHWQQWRVVGPYRLPAKLVIESHTGHRVTVRMRRFWPDVALSAATFKLEAPDQVQ